MRGICLLILGTILIFMLPAPILLAAGGGGSGSMRSHLKNLNTTPATVAEVLNDQHTFKGVTLRGYLSGNSFRDSSTQEAIAVTTYQSHEAERPKNIPRDKEVEIKGLVNKNNGQYSIILSRPVKVLEE